MKILIIGFQRSGTTLMRRILASHPDVRKMYHENFLLKKYKTKNALFNHVRQSGIDPLKDNWGEKVPFYPGIRGISVKVYCETWNQYFGKASRILHIVRHPIDVGRSINQKYKGQKFITGVRTYKRVMPNIIGILNQMPNCHTFKYEDLLLHPDKKINKLMKFCGLKEFDYKKEMAKYVNVKYREIDPSRAFAHKKTNAGSKIDLDDTITILNQIPGPKYQGGRK